MKYFQDFQNLLYLFGDEDKATIFQDLSRYANVVDQIKDDVTFLNFHTIQDGFRPDQVSIQLYETPLYYWTFYLLNDDIRQQGWPLINGEFQTYIQKIFPNKTVTTRDNISAKFKVGQTITGATSGASGVILRRDLSLGQMVVQLTTTRTFTTTGELLQSTNASGVVETVTSSSSANEYQAVHHYLRDDEILQNYNPLDGPGAQDTPVTFEEVWFNNNDSLKLIRVIKPSLISKVVTSYKKSLRE